MNRILYINGSPRGEKGSNSAQILKDLGVYLKDEGVTGEEVSILTLPRIYPEEPESQFQILNNSDIWIIALPLYVDALPGHLCRWLKGFEEYRKIRENKRNIRVYAIVNCGFPEAIQTENALKTLEIFCLKSGLSWGFGIGLGMGEAYRQMASIPLRFWGKRELLNSFKALSSDLSTPESPSHGNLFAAVKFPHRLYRIMGAFGWKSQIRKHGLKAGDLFAQPLAGVSRTPL
jgi:hypothetical protein